MFDAIANQTTIITPLSGVMLSAQLAVDGLKHVKADTLVIVPSLLEQIAKNPAFSDCVTRHVETIAYGGGDISQWSGDALTAKVNLFNFYGSTETGSFPLLRPSGKSLSKDWEYIHPHPAAGLDFRPTLHGQFEAIVVKNSGPEHEQPISKISPELDEYLTKDLWVPHPSKKGLWAYQGRADDTILFKPGYMCNPSSMEQRISQHPEVGAVLMVRTGRYQPALIMEPVNQQPMSTVAEQELHDRIWPTIQKASKMYMLGARVSKSHILYTNPQKPMRRASKGTVQRAPTVELYKEALDALYAREGGL